MKRLAVLCIVACVLALAAPVMAAPTYDVLLNAKTALAETGNIVIVTPPGVTANSTYLQIEFSAGTTSGEVTVYVATSTAGPWFQLGYPYGVSDAPHLIVIPIRVGAVKTTITTVIAGGATPTVTAKRIKGF